MRIRTVSVEVDVDLADIDTEDLIDELRDRESGGFSSGDDAVNEMYYALKFGQDDRAMELLRKYVQDATGKIL